MDNRRFIKSDNGEPIIIRNKKRMVNGTVTPKQESYIPEHKRLDLEPKIYNHNKDDFRMYTPKKRHVSSGAEEQSVKIKAQPFVHSGQNTDWVKNDKNMVSDEETYNDPINYDDVSLPEQFNNQEEEIIDDVSENNSEFSLSDIQPGQYVLLCDSEVIQFGTLQEIEVAVEHLLLSNDNGEELYSRLFVFKRMAIRTGVFIDG